MDHDPRPPRLATRTAVLESSGTGWGVLEPGNLAMEDRECVGSGDPRRYEVSDLLGRGGMGEVHLAFDERVGRDVALKVLSGDGGTRGDLRDSFLREARLQAVLDHPGIVPVHDLDRDDSGTDFLVMKRVVGTTLEEIIRRLRDGDATCSEKFPLRRLLSAYLQVCLTVDYAHARGVVHRDLKPSNLMLGDYGEVYVLDWGIAKVSEGEGLAQVLNGRAPPLNDLPDATYLVGTPGYMAPEQVDDASVVDARADVYSLGAVLFTLLTLSRLHPGRSTFEILESTRRGVDARPTVTAPDRGLLPEFDAICVRATATAPAERYANVRELHDAVASVLDGDRDMRVRVELAARHLMEAEQSLSSQGLPRTLRADAGRIALRHAARALALHPQSPEAAALVSRLMLMPPEEVPSEVEFETRALGGEETRRTDRSGAMVALGLLGLVTGLLAWAGVRSWTAAAMMLVPLMCAILIVVTAKSRSTSVPWTTLAAAVCFSFTVAGASRIAGPLMLAPTGVLLYAAVISWNHGLGGWRAACIGIVLLGAVVPWLLDVTGVTTSQYLVQEHGIFLTPDMIAFPGKRTEFGLAFGLTGAALLTLTTVFRFSRADVETRRRLQLVA